MHLGSFSPSSIDFMWSLTPCPWLDCSSLRSSSCMACPSLFRQSLHICCLLWCLWSSYPWLLCCCCVLCGFHQFLSLSLDLFASYQWLLIWKHQDHLCFGGQHPLFALRRSNQKNICYTELERATAGACLSLCLSCQSWDSFCPSLFVVWFGLTSSLSDQLAIDLMRLSRANQRWCHLNLCFAH